MVLNKKIFTQFVMIFSAFFFFQATLSVGHSKVVCNKSIQNRADGCSIPESVQWKGIKHTLNKDWRKNNKKRFRSQCNQHDIYYATLGKSKKSCDDTFRKGMHKKCNSNPVCLVEADIMYAAVHLEGGEGYKNGQKWGKNNCKKK